MKDRRSRAVVLELARQAGAVPRFPWWRRLTIALRRRWALRNRHASGLVMFAGENGPRDLDDPLSDPKVQARIGEAISKPMSRRRK